jgi:SAM-dependent methyltransferase
MAKTWTVPEILQIAAGYQPACVLAAAADLDLFRVLAPTGPAAAGFTAEEATARLHTDLRGTSMLLDALAALELLEKTGPLYHIPPTVAALLGSSAPGNILAMAQHQANCLRNWSQLGRVVKTGHPAEHAPSIRGGTADHEAFIEAMDNISAPAAPKIIADLQPLKFSHVLDVGGATGTWALEFLRQNPDPIAQATIFDLPEVIAQARGRVSNSGLAQRVRLVAGDYLVDELPGSVAAAGTTGGGLTGGTPTPHPPQWTRPDLAWVSAIIHSLSRAQSRDLYRRCNAALAPGGQILIRDFLMDAARTTPLGGALFAINMLVATERGGTYTVEEIAADLESAGFRDVKISRPDSTMHAVIGARKP